MMMSQFAWSSSPRDRRCVRSDLHAVARLPSCHLRGAMISAFNARRGGRHQVGDADVEAAVADFDPEALEQLRNAPRMSVPMEMGSLLKRCVARGSQPEMSHTKVGGYSRRHAHSLHNAPSP